MQETTRVMTTPGELRRHILEFKTRHRHLLHESYAPHQVIKSCITAKIIPPRIDFQPGQQPPFTISLFEPFKSVVAIAERRVYGSIAVRKNELPPGKAPELPENSLSVLPFPGKRVNIAKIGQYVWRVLQIPRPLKFCD